MNRLGLLLCAALVAMTLSLTGCQSGGSKKSTPAAKVTLPSSKDGAPWWDKDVSRIPDAVPRPHYGPYKAAPYTVLGKKYYPIQNAASYSETGLGSWYGTKFHGRDTANGEKYDLYGMTAAHKTLPLPSYVKVTNLENGRSVIVRVNDRGPFYADRIIDLSFAAAKKIGYAEKGVARVKVEGIDPEKWQAQQKATKKQQNIKQQQPTEYYPPAEQHASAKTVAAGTMGDSSSLYLQVGAFANPDAAQLLRDKLNEVTSTEVFVAAVVMAQQTLYRVRIGPINSRNEAELLQQRIRDAGHGNPSLVSN